jgi:hypothetical protein
MVIIAAVSNAARNAKLPGRHALDVLADAMISTLSMEAIGYPWNMCDDCAPADVIKVMPGARSTHEVTPPG